MIPILLRDLRPRIGLVVLAGWLFYLFEPGFHRHGPVDPGVLAQLGPAGLSATLANLAGVSMLILLAGFISTDRRRGYYRIYFSHPTNPLAFYGLRWGLALLLSLLAAAVFLVVGQLTAWGEFRGGWSGLLLALLSAVAYGGLVTFLSAVLPRGDAWVAVILFLFTFFWLQALALGAQPFSAPVRQFLSFVLPPQTALQDVYEEIVVGRIAWDSAAFVTGYGVVWLCLAAVLVRVREWP